MNIVIVTTPTKDLPESGFGDYESCKNVLYSIRKMGYKCCLQSCETLNDLNKITAREPDLVVLAVKYILLNNGDKIWLSEYFSDNHIAYTGSSRHTLEYDSDKVLAKRHLQKKGILTANFFTAKVGQYRHKDTLPIKYPLFLKPNRAANGTGINDQSYCSSYDDFNRKLYSLQRVCDGPVLVEEYLSGKEYTVSILSDKSGKLLVSGVEIIPPISDEGHRILSGRVKEENTECLLGITDPGIKDEINKIAFDAYVELGVNGFARVDIRVDCTGKYYFMEINLVPGMTLGSSYFPEALKIGLKQSYDQTVAHIIEYSLHRKSEKRVASSSMPLSEVRNGHEARKQIGRLSIKMKSRNDDEIR